MNNVNKLKEIMNAEISRAVNKYNAAVFVLNGNSTTKALETFKYNVGGKALRILCRDSNPDAYNELREIEKNKSWYSEVQKIWYYNDVSLCDLRKNKHLFIGVENQA